MHNYYFCFLLNILWLKNTIAALYSSRPQGAKDFTRNNHLFGWKTIEKLFAEDLERAENGLSRKVPGLKYAHVYRDNWTRLNVRPAKIMQVCFITVRVKCEYNDKVVCYCFIKRLGILQSHISRTV